VNAPFPHADLAAAEAVVIGTSAGGVDALLGLLSALPRNFHAPVLVVIHLPPDSPSGLAALFGSRCALPVFEAIDKQPITPGTVVLAPPNYHLLVEPTRTLALSMDEPVFYSRPAVDLLFDSASIAYGSRLLALLLTGGSEDGSKGLAAVRRRGGKAWVQDPLTAVASAMPAAGLALAGADDVLTLSEMGQRFASSGFLPDTRRVQT